MMTYLLDELRSRMLEKKLLRKRRRGLRCRVFIFQRVPETERISDGFEYGKG
jgi:hypothetical protein